MNNWACGLAAAIGGAGALVDRNVLRRPVLGALFVLLAAAGLLTTQASPFNFAGTSYYMEGVIASEAGGIAFAAYLVIRLATIAYAGLSGGKTS